MYGKTSRKLSFEINKTTKQYGTYCKIMLLFLSSLLDQKYVSFIFIYIYKYFKALSSL